MFHRFIQPIVQLLSALEIAKPYPSPWSSSMLQVRRAASVLSTSPALIKMDCSNLGYWEAGLYIAGARYIQGLRYGKQKTERPLCRQRNIQFLSAGLQESWIH